jgi:hypothetical protein
MPHCPVRRNPTTARRVLRWRNAVRVLPLARLFGAPRTTGWGNALADERRRDDMTADIEPCGETEPPEDTELPGLVLVIATLAILMTLALVLI